MNTKPDRAGVIAPPPLIFLAFLAAALGLHYGCCPLPTGWPESVRYTLAVLLTSGALALLVGAGSSFHQAGTNIRPWQPTTAIVEVGPYRWTRNPMYLGMTLIYLAVGLWADSWMPVLLLWPLLETVKRGVIWREERYLSEKFGDEYRHYQSRVRRWF